MIYFDNGATTYPKPASVPKAVYQAFFQFGANPGRSGHKMSVRTAKEIYSCRELIAELFQCETENVVFTGNCTHGLNLAIKGFLKKGDHVLLSDLEHNSVSRPIHRLAQAGIIEYDVVQTALDPQQTVRAFEEAVKPNTRLIVCTHGSNVFGISMPIREIGAFAHEKGIRFMVDAAQTAGVIPISMEQDNIDILCTAGHKSLYGPTGTGLLLTTIPGEIDTILEGGTGTASLDLNQPWDMPEHLESGTVNTMGIIGLKAGVSFVKRRGMEAIYRHEMEIITLLYNQLAKEKNVILYTPKPMLHSSLPVLSFNIEGLTGEETASQLSEMGFGLRGGFHCAFLAHRKMGTEKIGTARISVGAFNTKQEAIQLGKAISLVAKRQRSHI